MVQAGLSAGNQSHLERTIPTVALVDALDWLSGTLSVRESTSDYHPEQQSYLRTRERGQGVFLDGVENRTGRRSP